MVNSQLNEEKIKIDQSNHIKLNRDRLDRVSLLVRKLDDKLSKSGYISNDQTQIDIENFCLDQFKLLGQKKTYEIIPGED